MQVVVRHGPQGGVLWVDAVADGHAISLGGYCRYWHEDLEVGGFACPEHPEVGQVSYRWTGARFVRERRFPPLSTEVWTGEWLSDDEWRKVRG